MNKSAKMRLSLYNSMKDEVQTIIFQTHEQEILYAYAYNYNWDIGFEKVWEKAINTK